MAESTADVRSFAERVCARPGVVDAWARCDLGVSILALDFTGFTQGSMFPRIGPLKTRPSRYPVGTRKLQQSSTFEAFAETVGPPNTERRTVSLVLTARSALRRVLAECVKA